MPPRFRKDEDKLSLCHDQKKMASPLYSKLPFLIEGKNVRCRNEQEGSLRKRIASSPLEWREAANLLRSRKQGLAPSCLEEEGSSSLAKEAMASFPLGWKEAANLSLTRSDGLVPSTLKRGGHPLSKRALL